MIKQIKPYLGVAAGFVTFVIVAFLVRYPDAVETLYYKGLFRLIRSLYDYTLGWLPIPMIFVALPVMIAFIVRCMRVRLTEHRARWWSIVLGLANATGWLITVFYLTWGFNYRRPPIEDTMGIASTLPVDSTSLVQEFAKVTAIYGAEREAISLDSAALTDQVLPDGMEREIRAVLTDVLADHHYITSGRPRVRILRPSGILLRISTAGVYLPYAMEGHIDAGLHPIQYPYTMAHEMSHGYGFTDEGVCNFLALLACLRSDRPILRYSALRVYWLYLAQDVRRLDERIYQRQLASLPEGVRADNVAVRQQMDRFPDILPAVRDAIYDTYLKGNGVRAGLSSYGQVVELALSYQAVYGPLW